MKPALLAMKWRIQLSVELHKRPLLLRKESLRDALRQDDIIAPVSVLMQFRAADKNSPLGEAASAVIRAIRPGFNEWRYAAA